MLFSHLVGKTIFVGNTPRGVCLGVGVSLKSKAVKYLLCASNPTSSIPDFAVNASTVVDTDEAGIYLSRLRAIFPQACAKLFPSMPVYLQNGVYLGALREAELPAFTAVCIFTDKGEICPISNISACADAVIVRKKSTYPLGQRIPAPYNEENSLVTRPVLRRAIERGELIKLTLSLPPFTKTAR